MDTIKDAYKEVLAEGKIANALIAGAIATVGLSHHFNRLHPLNPVSHESVVKTDPVSTLSSKIQSKYKKIKPHFADHVAALAVKHAHPVFPKAEDIVSIVGIESSFNPDGKSGLKKDPARGLTQIRPKVWGLDHKVDLATPEDQIKKGVDILATYHEKLGSPEAAVHAYNIGITNYKRGTGLNPSYVDKFNRERSMY